MLRELTKQDWLLMLNLPKKRIPKVLILRGTRSLKREYEHHLQYFDNTLEIGSPNNVLQDVFIGDLDGFPVAYASVYGAPMASGVVHVFGVLGTSLVIQSGCCGALSEAIGVGDIVVAKEAYCGEGASQYYNPKGKTVKASTQFLQILSTKSPHDILVHFGKIYTTSALFAEGREEIEEWYGKGFSGVDMETAATFAVAEHFGMKRISILFVFDNPRRKESILMKDTEKDERRTLGKRCMIDLVLQVTKEYNISTENQHYLFQIL